MDRKIVIPGELISENEQNAGYGTYVKDGNVYASVYGVLNVKNKVDVIPFSGKYVPSKKDYIIGTVTDVTSSNWLFDIRSPYTGMLHVSEFPKRVESSKMSEYIDVGDSAILRVKDVDQSMKIELTLRERGLKRVKQGRVLEFPPSKVPRIIGHGGSMVSMLKKETKCEIFVGQNGRIWISGSEEKMDQLTDAIRLIVKESHIHGLTDKIYDFLTNEKNVIDIETYVSSQDEIEFQEDDEIPEDIHRKVDALLDSSED
ncbi:exosome complex RNA-binding protein Rrp4 [Methanosalsum natronophilum]|uniref:Exosome complex component Rrp4 n=1 Tax=Methanosalsum natronophilum TaxID=768733 RepID=A0A3R7XR11_9EURY|nr:exosome complex RNA-binding protein Rrp4 [Methanosalsum natronophilum]MCS3924057.1 exosome complex component RRP4 [Methanosalsum natronophilum]RQD81397.1 MAG: S1 RNA-binding domain-containing protein [Methanosalsum natronophilum]